MVFGSIISAVGNVAGSLIGSSSNKSAAKSNANLQREFAQNGITWKVEDAKRAGIHPLYAVGAPTVSANPSYVGDTHLSQGVANLGQDIGRAIHATRNSRQRADALSDLQLERGQLENDLLRSQIAKINQAPNPAMPTAIMDATIDGQGDSTPTSGASALVQPQPSRPIASQPAKPYQEAGAVSDYSFTRSGPLSYAVVPSKDGKERMEDSIFADLSWAARNYLVRPWIAKSMAPPKKWLPKGYKRWRYSPLTGEYTASKY